jgi:hypothetical protein
LWRLKVGDGLSIEQGGREEETALQRTYGGYCGWGNYTATPWRGSGLRNSRSYRKNKMWGWKQELLESL